MKASHYLLSGCIACMLFAAFPAHAVIDADAAVVKLRTSCAEAGVILNNCFTDLPSLNAWIWNTRNPAPSATSALLVEIGPGSFTGTFGCNNKGYVTLRGAGMGKSIIQNGSSPVSTTNCVNLSFSHLTLRNTGTLFGVRNLGGSTVWDNVEIDGLGYAWFDSPSACGGTGGGGTHYWFSSRITARTSGNSTTAYFNACDVSWFFGSEITAIGSNGQVSPIVAVGGEVHVYGSVIRAISNTGAVTSSFVAVQATGESGTPAKIHIHGTGIDVISPAANNIVALAASNGGEIHANQSSYNLSTGAGGTVTRISNSGGHIHAPYLWEQHPNPPAITSVTGADTAIITGTSDGHPHLVIYDSNCASKWFDSTLNTCR